MTNQRHATRTTDEGPELEIVVEGHQFAGQGSADGLARLKAKAVDGGGLALEISEAPADRNMQPRSAALTLDSFSVDALRTFLGSTTA